MKNQGSILIEVVIAMGLFYIILFPLVDFNNQIFKINSKQLILQKECKNFEILKKQLRVIKNEELKRNYGRHEYRFENGEIIGDNFLDNIIFPYKVYQNTKIIIEVYPARIFSNDEVYTYITVAVMYIINNKIITSREIISEFGEKDEV